MMTDTTADYNVGFFGGTFDPIHFGHLKMATELMHAKNLQEVWFSPNWISPHKLDRQPAPIQHRLGMVELAIENEPKFKLLDLEAKKEEPSYTIDTLRQLATVKIVQHSKKKIFLILSDESVKDFFKWKDPEEIISLVPLLIGSRKSGQSIPPTLEGTPEICQAITEGWTPTSPIDISSTEIRKRVKNGQNCDDLVPKKVLDYIYQNKLYC